VIAGAEGDEIHTIADMMVREKMVSVSKAEEILKGMRNNGRLRDIS
jgi:hypothetical protein